MLSSSPPAVLPLISGLPPLCGHPHPPSARTCCTPAALPVTLVDTAWSLQPRLYQETACSLQGWEHTEQANSAPEPTLSWHCIAHTPSNAPWSSEGPWMKPRMIPTGHCRIPTGCVKPRKSHWNRFLFSSSECTEHAVMLSFLPHWVLQIIQWEDYLLAKTPVWNLSPEMHIIWGSARETAKQRASAEPALKNTTGILPIPQR